MAKFKLRGVRSFANVIAHFSVVRIPHFSKPNRLTPLQPVHKKISRELLLGDHTTAILSPFPEDERRVLPVQALRFFFWGPVFRDQKKAYFSRILTKTRKYEFP